MNQINFLNISGSDFEKKDFINDTSFSQILSLFNIKNKDSWIAFDLETVNKDLQKTQNKIDYIKSKIDYLEKLYNWLGFISTPYGYFILNSIISQSKLIQSCLLRITTHHPDFKFQLPLLFALNNDEEKWKQLIENKDNDCEPLDILLKSLRTWQSMEKGIGSITGKNLIKYKHLQTSIIILENWLGGSGKLYFPIEKDMLQLGAGYIASGLSIGGDSIIKAGSKATILLYFQKIISEIKDNLELHQISKENILNLNDFEIKTLFFNNKSSNEVVSETDIITLIALLDLALFTPLHPFFTPLRKTLRWEDLHPGMRFKKAMDYIKQDNLKLESIEQWAYWNFIDKICKALEWPTPKEFIEFIKIQPEKCDTDYAFSLLHDSITLREVNPIAFLNIVNYMHELNELIPPIGQTGKIFDEDNKKADIWLWIALEAELYNISLQLLYSDKEPQFQYEIFSSLINILGSKNELILNYFGLDFNKKEDTNGDNI